ncbi:MAG: hypothetical protein ABSD59_20480 [Terracidiphilus sp.]
MFMRPKIQLRSIATRVALGLATVCVAGTSVSHAQFIVYGCMPGNTLQIENQGILTTDPVIWSPGHSYTVFISGTYPIAGSACPNTDLSVTEWPKYPDLFEFGPSPQYIHLSKLTWVNSTTTTFDVSVDSGAPTGMIILYLTGAFGYWDYWGVSIQPSPPPNPPSPSPPPPQACPTPALDPNTPVTPDTWIPGKTYQIKVKGTGFTTQAASSLPNCPATTITLSVKTGSVNLSNIVVVDPTTITATVAPAGTDPGETVDIMLWGPPPSVN